ncbi:MAG: hypothetical protein JKY55_20295 [Aliivibrio sp.]|uniref:Wzz/FepE/Etk N-terminal domain-containing protein n=1 Tax=Aliivibrio sp. TaxID=1872443 RepID=UPI001A53B495|nr:hypothetical protein [Aliivibrio sp.]
MYKVRQRYVLEIALSAIYFLRKKLIKWINLGKKMAELEINDLVKIIWKQKKMVVATAFSLSVVAFGFTFLMTKIYEAKVIMAPVSEDSSGGLAKLANQFGGGLASLAGIGGGGGTLTDTYIASLKSREFTYKFMEKHNVLQVLHSDIWDKDRAEWKLNFWQKSPPTQWGGYNKFNKNIRSIQESPKTGLITLSIQWEDAQLAEEWANAMALEINEYLRAKAITRSEGRIQFLTKKLNNTGVGTIKEVFSRLLEHEMQIQLMANADKYYAFEVLDKAVISETKVRPNRIGFAIMFFLFGGFVGSIRAVLISQRKR